MPKKSKIVTDVEKLRGRASEVNMNNLREAKRISSLVEYLKNLLRENDGLIALAAPQVGKMDRVFCIKFANGDIRGFINPLIFARKGGFVSRERQIGVSDTEYLIFRNNEVRAAYNTPSGKAESNAFLEAVGAVFQQMVDLLDGVLLADYGLEVIDGFDEASDDEKSQIIDMYLQSLDERKKAIEEHIEQDDFSRMLDANIDLMSKISTGEVKMEPLTEEEAEQVRKYREAHAKDV